jgi:hypothetical protein
MGKPETEFRAWRRRLAIKSQAEAARMIGRSLRQVAAYEAGAEIPRVVWLAMVAVEILKLGPDGVLDKLEAMR